MTSAPRLLLLALATALLAGCQSLATAGRDAKPARLQGVLARGELRVGLSGNQPPLNMKSRDGAIIGLEVELVEALASSMGLRPELVQKPFGDLLPALERGEVDRLTLPVENSTTGSVLPVLDRLPGNPHHGPVSIIAEHLIEVRHALLGLPGTDLAQVTAKSQIAPQATPPANRCSNAAARAAR